MPTDCMPSEWCELEPSQQWGLGHQHKRTQACIVLSRFWFSGSRWSSLLPQLSDWKDVWEDSFSITCLWRLFLMARAGWLCTEWPTSLQLRWGYPYWRHRWSTSQSSILQLWNGSRWNMFDWLFRNFSQMAIQPHRAGSSEWAALTAGAIPSWTPAGSAPAQVTASSTTRAFVCAVYSLRVCGCPGPIHSWQALFTSFRLLWEAYDPSEQVSLAFSICS